MNTAEETLVIGKTRIYPDPYWMWILFPLAIAIFGGLAWFGNTAWLACIGVVIALMWLELLRRSHTEIKTVVITETSVLVKQAERTQESIPFKTVTHLRLRRSWYGKPCYTAINGGSGWTVLSPGKVSEEVFLRLKTRLHPAISEERRESRTLGAVSATFGAMGVACLVAGITFGKAHKSEGDIMVGAAFAITAMAVLVDMLQCGGEWRHDPNFKSRDKQGFAVFYLIIMAATRFYL